MVGHPLGAFRMYGWERFDAELYATEGKDYVPDVEMNTYHYKDGEIRYSYWDPATNEVVGDDYGQNYVDMEVLFHSAKTKEGAISDLEIAPFFNIFILTLLFICCQLIIHIYYK